MSAPKTASIAAWDTRRILRFLVASMRHRPCLNSTDPTTVPSPCATPNTDVEAVNTWHMSKGS